MLSACIKSVLGTAKAAWDLLEKRSEIYSSRPRFVVGGEILSGNMRGLMLPYGEPWRSWRRVLHSGFNSRRAVAYEEIQNVECKVLLKDLLDGPEGHEKHLQRYVNTKEEHRGHKSCYEINIVPDLQVRSERCHERHLRQTGE